MLIKNKIKAKAEINKHMGLQPMQCSDRIYLVMQRDSLACPVKSS
jgi:hypothetical protein